MSDVPFDRPDTTNVYGNPEVVAHHIEQVILETRKRDLLEGVEQSRKQLLDQPFVRNPHWDQVWEQLVDPVTGRPHRPVLVIVAPRSYGSTTLALRLLAEHTADDTTVVQLDADWDTPARDACRWRRRTRTNSTSSIRTTTRCPPTS